MRFNELLAARFNEGISSLFGLAEQEGIRSVSPELMPVFVAEGERVEHSYPKNERKGAGQGAVNADAANFSIAALVNPPGSNVLVAVEKVYASRTTNGSLLIGLVAFNAGMLGTIMGAGVRDTRWGGNLQMCAAQLRRGVTGAQPLGLGSPALQYDGTTANVTVVDSTDWVLSPGWALGVCAVAINVGLNFGVTWRERALLPEEQ